VESDVTRANHTVLINDWDTIIIVITYVVLLYAAEIGELEINKFAQHSSTLIYAALQVDDSADRQNKNKGVVFVRYFLTQCPGVIWRFFPFPFNYDILQKSGGGWSDSCVVPISATIPVKQP
jgi:hypothetical protein